jgi:hypothetical protein
VADERVRIEVGFDGGQVMSVLTTTESVEQLEQALGAGQDGAIAIDADDGRYTLALRRIVYVKRLARESRVGFGAAGP